MKHKLYKNILTVFALCLLGTLNAQKYDKKFTENFKVNKDVEVAINASNTDINVTTWNKNEVQVEAFIEIEGLSKEEAEKYFTDCEFEALGNKRKVEIMALEDNSFGLKNDFIFFNNADFSFPDIEMPNFDSIVIPDMEFNFDFDFENIFEDLEDLDENMGESEKYSFQWNDGVNKVVIKSKKEWDAFKKTKKYKELKEKMSFEKTKMKKKFAKSKEKMKRGLAKAKLEYKKVDKEKIKLALVKAKETLKNMKFNFSSDSNDLMINGKKIKIKKRLEIKVPKGATFDLNTRHCKVKLPNTVASGNVKYGSFDVNNLNGGKLTIDYSNVKINDLNACNLFLNNVTDAKIASVTNTTMINNSSGVNIFKVNKDVTVSDKFGELTIQNFDPNFGEFILNLSQSNTVLILGDTNSAFKYKVNNVQLDNKRAAFLNKNNVKNNLIKINGDYSEVIIK